MQNRYIKLPETRENILIEQTIFEAADLKRIGLVCDQCGTESIFDLAKPPSANTSRDCPGCGEADFLEAFFTEAKQHYNWVSYYQRGLHMTKNVKLRFYFESKTDLK
jgi:hypothetical protein